MNGETNILLLFARVLRSINKEIALQPVMPWFIREGGSRQVRGLVDGNTFRLKRWNARQWSPNFYDKWEADYSGTRILSGCWPNCNSSYGSEIAQISKQWVRKQKTDRQDAKSLLHLLLEDRFPRIWVASLENCD